MRVGGARVRPARLDDAPALATLTTQLGYPVDAAEQAQRLADLLADPHDHAVLVAIDEDDRPIGWAHVERLRMLEHSRTAQLMGMVVDERHRSGGFGSALLWEAEAQARAWGCESIVLRSRVTRERAHRFYERAGYRVLKTSYTFEKRLDEEVRHIGL